jgi:hypothetical protein
LSEDEGCRNRGALFGSIHHTLNHLVVGDLIWLARLRLSAWPGVESLAVSLLEMPFGVSLGRLLFEDAARLVGASPSPGARLGASLVQLHEHFAGLSVRCSNTKDVLRAHPVALGLAHLFNHQTHHRGQATTLLIQVGVDVGVADLVAMPAVLYPT